MNIPANLFYTKSHEWVEFLEDGSCRVGISDFAQNAMGDIVYIDLPEVGSDMSAGDELCDIESVKAVASVFCPVGGTIDRVNTELDDAPESINEKPYEAWIAVLAGAQRPDDLMDAAAYAAHCESEEHA